MILTCPECATSYFVGDSQIPASGRSVKCTNCGARWMATPDGAVEPAAPPAPEEPAPAPEAVTAETAAESASAASAAPPSAAEDLDFVSTAEPESARDRVRALRAAAARPSSTGAAKASPFAFVWAAAAALVVALIAAAVLFRAEVARLWPASSAVYAAVGLPVDNLGLVIESVHVEPTFQGGRPVLSLTGAIRNVKGRAATAPPLRVSLLDRAGKPIAARIARPLDPRIPPGARRHFAIAITDPPANAHDLRIAFEVATPQRAAAAAPIPPPPPARAPVDAQPLPPGTPDALSEHG
jgi:predicted Zn finger-like uncharacterized protein